MINLKKLAVLVCTSLFVLGNAAEYQIPFWKKPRSLMGSFLLKSGKDQPHIPEFIIAEKRCFSAAVTLFGTLDMTTGIFMYPCGQSCLRPVQN